MLAVLAHEGPAARDGAHTHVQQQGTGGGAGGGALRSDGSRDGAEAEHALCCHSLFSLLDCFHEWSAQLRARGADDVRKRLTRLSSQLPPLVLVRAALRSGGHFRALRIIEAYADEENRQALPQVFLRPAWQGRTLCAEAFALLHRAYAATAEPDGLQSLGSLRARDGAAYEDELEQQERKRRRISMCIPFSSLVLTLSHSRLLSLERSIVRTRTGEDTRQVKCLRPCRMAAATVML
eukprot:6181274-Pleurochrysis_carterae.AAC.1